MVRRYRIYLDEVGEDKRVIRRLCRIDIVEGDTPTLQVRNKGRSPVRRYVSQHSVDILMDLLQSGDLDKHNIGEGK